jgi:WhiB family redox-sensing transcriptional regulator
MANRMTLTTERPLTGTPDDPRPWTRRAACTGQTKLFYPPPSERPEARAVRELQASLICRTCPVVTPCREWAREHREYGYWGDESEDARASAGYRVRFPSSVRRNRRADPDRAA